MSDLTLLHVGLHKTASTSFQITCRNNRQALAQSGFNYPNLFDLNGGKRTANHSCALFNLFSGSRLNYHLNAGKDVHSIERDVSIYKRNLLAELFKDGNLILSGEDVSALNSQGQDRLAIYLAAFSRILKTLPIRTRKAALLAWKKRSWIMVAKVWDRQFWGLWILTSIRKWTSRGLCQIVAK